MPFEGKSSSLEMTLSKVSRLALLQSLAILIRIFALGVKFLVVAQSVIRLLDASYDSRDII